MSVSTIEKLAVIMHRFGIDFNEFNVKFENIEQQDAIAILSQENILLPQAPSSWAPYALFLDPRGYVSASLLGNGIYKYVVEQGSPAQGFMTASNPIYNSLGSLLFWASASSFFGDDIYPIFGGMNVGFGSTTEEGRLGYVAYSANTNYAVPNPVVHYLGEWQFFVVKQDAYRLYNYGNGLLGHTGSARNITGSIYFFDNYGFFDPDFYNPTLGFANIALTNREVSEAQILAIKNAGVTANYKDILGFTPEAYWKGPPVSGSPQYVPNEVF